MSPRAFAATPEAVLHAERRLWIDLGQQLRDARLARRWTVADLATRAGVSSDLVYLIEAGKTASTEAVLRLVTALSRRIEMNLVDPRRRSDTRAGFAGDPVHSAMGEFEAGHLRAAWRERNIGIGLDEPYQHYQFAGQADVVAWDLEMAALLHIENRTRFPDFQEMAGAFNAKRAYLGNALAERLRVRRWRSETNVVAALWSSEVLHAVRLRPNSFKALCPDPLDLFDAWWRGMPPPPGTTSTLIVIDPMASGRR